MQTETAQCKTDAPRALVFQPLVKGNEALETRLDRVMSESPAVMKVASQFVCNFEYRTFQQDMIQGILQRRI